MLKKDETTPGDAVPEGTVPVTTETKPKEEVTPEKKTEEKTIGEIAGEGAPEVKKETVGLDKFLDEKGKRKAAEKELADLKLSIESGATRGETAADIEAFTKKYPDVDPAFVKELASAIRSETEKSLDDKYSPKLNALDKKERDAKVDAAFKAHFDLAMEKMPEMKDVVVPSVIKSLSLDPSNSKKTITQLIEEVYGNSVPGKRTAETRIAPGGGKEPAPLDMARARKDTTYFKEIMADPKLKAEYNDRMIREGL